MKFTSSVVLNLKHLPTAWINNEIQKIRKKKPHRFFLSSLHIIPISGTHNNLVIVDHGSLQKLPTY